MSESQPPVTNMIGKLISYCFLLAQSVDPYSDVPGSHVRATMLNLSLECFEGTTTE